MRLIDADALIKKICGNECGSVCDEECENAACNFYDYIMDAPTIEPEVRHGRWMFHEQKNGYLWKCSNCKGNFDQQFSYCPHCGARMDGGVEDGNG